MIFFSSKNNFKKGPLLVLQQHSMGKIWSHYSCYRLHFFSSMLNWQLYESFSWNLWCKNYYFEYIGKIYSIMQGNYKNKIYVVKFSRWGGEIVTQMQLLCLIHFRCSVHWFIHLLPTTLHKTFTSLHPFPFASSHSCISKLFFSFILFALLSNFINQTHFSFPKGLNYVEVRHTIFNNFACW